MVEGNGKTSGPGAGAELLGGKYLTFALGSEEYGLGIHSVREIIGMMPVTPVPRTPHHVKGVINLRGRVIPVVDLRLKLGMDEAETTDRTCIIVAEAGREGQTTAWGLVVDAVNEVANVKGEEIEECPTGAAGLDEGFILGMAKSGNKVKVLLDTDGVLHSDVMGGFGQAA